MSDVRAKLTEALKAHPVNRYGQHDGWWECRCSPDEPHTPEHLADVVLSLPGVAIVALPQASGINGSDNRVWRPPGFYVEQELDGDVIINDRLSVCADELRALAAALLAAADTAEAAVR